MSNRAIEALGRIKMNTRKSRLIGALTAVVFLFGFSLLSQSAAFAVYSCGTYGAGSYNSDSSCSTTTGSGTSTSSGATGTTASGATSTDGTTTTGTSATGTTDTGSGSTTGVSSSSGATATDGTAKAGTNWWIVWAAIAVCVILIVIGLFILFASRRKKSAGTDTTPYDPFNTLK